MAPSHHPRVQPICPETLNGTQEATGSLSHSAALMNHLQAWMGISPGTHIILALQFTFWALYGRNIQPDVLHIKVTMANILLATRYSPQQWCKGLNAMLEKMAGNFNIEKILIES